MFYDFINAEIALLNCVLECLPVHFGKVNFAELTRPWTMLAFQISTVNIKEIDFPNQKTFSFTIKARFSLEYSTSHKVRPKTLENKNTEISSLTI